jgi:predicted nucleic acid-binding protein
VVPLLVGQPTTAALQGLYSADPDLLVWWATELECSSALARLERENTLSQQNTNKAFERLDALKGVWTEVQPSEKVRVIARRLLRTHPLRSADAQQLAAAIIASEGQSGVLLFVTLDARLIAAAHREGLAVVDVD